MLMANVQPSNSDGDVLGVSVCVRSAHLYRGDAARVEASGVRGRIGRI